VLGHKPFQIFVALGQGQLLKEITQVGVGLQVVQLGGFNQGEMAELGTVAELGTGEKWLTGEYHPNTLSLIQKPY
jgi:hypothetical protein